MNSTNAERQLGTLTILLRILSHLRAYKRHVIIGFSGMIAAQALAITIPTILRQVIDRGVERGDSDYMLRAGLLVVGLGALRGVASFLSRYFTESQSHRVAYNLRNEFYDKVQRLPFSYHDTAHTGSLITRGISDVDEIQRFLAFGLMDGLNTLLLVSFSIGMMFFSSAPLAAVSILPLIPLAYRSKNFAQYVESEWRKVMEQLSSLGNALQESVVGGEVVRAFARETHEIKKFSSKNQELFDQHIKLVDAWSLYVPFSAIMTALSVFLTLVFGTILQQRGSGNVTVGVIVQFNAYILLMAQPIRFSGFAIMLINQGIASGRRVLSIIDAPETISDKDNAIVLENVTGHVCFESVSFRYSEHSPTVLEDINISAEPGQVIAVIGETGSGKSTLVNLIPRFYDVTGGRIMVDNHDIRDVTTNSLKSHVGIVLQESLLFSATIRENIAFGNPTADEQSIIEAAKAANAHDFITEFPEGYDTVVGERGVTLSGGQRQRVAIARAIIIDPAILILDDSTSSVDTRTEHLIQEALGRLMQGRTTFVIAQRLTTVLRADRIIVLDQGRIAEEGTHQELLAVGGLYKDIYDLQLADQERVRREMLTLQSYEIVGD